MKDESWVQIEFNLNAACLWFCGMAYKLSVYGSSNQTQRCYIANKATQNPRYVFDLKWIDAIV